MAPPLMLSLSSGISSWRYTWSAWQANASLSSTRTISRMVRPL